MSDEGPTKAAMRDITVAKSKQLRPPQDRHRSTRHRSTSGAFEITMCRTRPAHSAMDGFIAPMDDGIWKRWSPPAGHNCRCRRIALTEAQARARGYPKADPSVDPDKGWEGDPTEGNDDLVQIIRARQQSCQTTFAAKKARARGLWCDEGAAQSLIKRAGESLVGGENASMPPIRHAWKAEDPDVLIVAGESAVKKHASYRAAKAGSSTAAWALVSDFLSAAPEITVDILHGATSVLAVHALEEAGVNEIPSAMAAWLARRFGLPMASGVVQTNRVGHTGSSGWHRLATQALFDGEVMPGEAYLLVDDFVGQGGTFANLRGYVLAKGARVAGFVSLTGNPRSSKIALDRTTLLALRDKHGSLESWWSNEFGFGFEALTESEAGYLLRVDADTIRSRMAQARQQAGG